MLKDLKILNGFLDLDFNEYIYEYTISVKKDINSLDIFYEVEDGYIVNIRNNLLYDGENIVYLDVCNNEYTKTYTLYVYKEKEEYASGIDNFISSLEVSSAESVSFYKVQILSVSMFFLLVILFSLIFRKSKKTYKV